jgi:AbrB family looped-hinge helix DNA binding protein
MNLNSFSKVTSKGQITIPHSIREQLHLSTGSKLEFVIKDNTVIMMPINNKLSNLHGILPKLSKTISIDEMNNYNKKKHDRS